MKRTKLFFTAAVLTAVALVAAACGGGASPDGAQTFKCGSQGYAEVEIVCEMAKAMIEAHTDHRVEHVTNLGSALAVHEATLSGDLDMNSSFTGTHFLGTFEMELTDEWRDPDKVWQFVHDEMLEQFDMKMSEPFGYNNVYALIVHEDTAEELGLENASDVAPYAADWVLGTDDTFQEYPGQGYDEWTDVYGFEFKDAVAMAYGLLFRAAASGDVDVSMGYSTDGRIPALGLKVLEDDKNFNPPYYGVLIMRNEMLEQYPEVADAIAPLAWTTDTATMSQLNQRVDVDEEEPRDVARSYLTELGLLD